MRRFGLVLAAAALVGAVNTAEAQLSMQMGNGWNATFSGNVNAFYVYNTSDPDGTIAAYSWRQIAGPAVTLTGANTSQPTFTAPNTTTTIFLDFEVTVTDNNGATAIDVVRITVIK